MNRRNEHVINEEVTYSNQEQWVSTTDLRGVITYANDVFCKVAGYLPEEIVGKNHHIVRHLDMPKAAFHDLWLHAKAGRPWRGAGGNHCKDGRYYWADAYMTPIYENGKITGYQSVRTQLDDKTRDIASGAYRQLLKQQQQVAEEISYDVHHISTTSSANLSKITEVEDSSKKLLDRSQGLHDLTPFLLSRD